MGAVVTYTLQTYFIFCAAHLFMHLAAINFQQSAVSCYYRFPLSHQIHKMLMKVPELHCSQSYTITNNRWGHFRCLFAPVTHRTIYQGPACHVFLNDGVLLAGPSVFIACFYSGW